MSMDGSKAARGSALGKLSIPRLGRRLARPRLFAALDAMSESPGLWLTGPPGAGKTTLAATWLQQRGEPVLWFQADPGDADPATFMRWLDELWQQQLTQPLALPPPASEDLTDLAGWMRRRLRTLLPLLPPRWSLVFDNHHELPPRSPLHGAMAAALAELPAGVHWTFVSRDVPPAAFANAVARQQLRTLGADALRLDDAEALGLVRLHGRSDAVLAALAPAQGWAAGMTLMLLGEPRAAELPALDAQERLFDYFAEEVLARMQPAEQRTLSLLAQLPSMSAELAVAMSGDPGAPALLDRLARAGHFVDRHEAPHRVYGMHALFSAFLRRRHETTAASGDRDEVRLRAGRLLLLAGETDAGLAQLSAAQAWDEAEAAVQQHAPTYLLESRMQALRPHIDALPPPAAERLAGWRGVCSLDHDPAAALADAQLAHQSASADGDPVAQLVAVALAASALVALGRMQELDGWIAALDALGDEPLIALDDPVVELRVVPALVAALVFHRPWHRLTEGLVARAERLLHRRAATGQRLMLGPLAYYLLWRGEGSRLQRLILLIDSLCDPALAAPAALLRWWSVAVLIKTLTGELDAAERDLSRMVETIAGEPQLAAQTAPAHMQGALLALARADKARTRRHLDAAAPMLRPDSASDRSMHDHMLAMLALLTEDRAAALRLARAASESGRLGGFVIREHIAAICHALAASCADEHDAARALIEQVRRHRVWPMCLWHQWIAGCVAVYAALRRGDRAAAIAEIRHAMTLAREYGFGLGPQLMVVAELMPRVLALALAEGIEPEVARGLIRRFRLAAPADADHRWPWPVRIRVLGGLQVEVDDGPLPSSRKESRRLLELLGLLGAHGTRLVAQDSIADEIWPDADGDAARNALDNALHRLRKALGGDDRILLRQGNLALSVQRCWTDVDAVQRELAILSECAADDLALHLSTLRALYGRPVLPGSPLPMVVARRKLLDHQVRRAVAAAVARLESAGLSSQGRTARLAWPEIFSA